MLERPLGFTGYSSIQFSNSPPFPKIVISATLGALPLAVLRLSDLRDAL